MKTLDTTATRPRSGAPLRVLTHLVGLEPSGGVELCVLQDSMALADRGHTFDIVYGHHGEAAVLRPAYEARGFGLEGPHLFDLELRHPIRTVTGYLPAARWARSRHVDVVWLNRFEHIFWGQAVARWSGAPLVCHLHGVPMFNRVRELGAGVAHFLAVSHFVRDAWVDRGLPPDRVSLLHNAIPRDDYPSGGSEERAAARRRLALPPEVPVVLCYGRMIVEKGTADLLRAWREITVRDPDALLVLVGSPSPWDDPVLRRELARLDPRSVRWFPETLDVVDHLHASDVVVFPSLLQEAFGRVVIEGMSTGRPVVATRVGAVGEILTGPMARFLVDPGAPAQLVARLITLLHWREQEPRLGRECAQWVAERFPFEAHVDALERMLQRHRRRRTERPAAPR